MENFQGSYIFFIYITVQTEEHVFWNCYIFLYPPPLPPAQITTNDQFRSYSENIFCYILQVRDELCLAHEAFQFFRKFNLKPLITKKFIRQIFPDRNTDLVMEGPIHHQPSSTNERRRLKTDIYCKHHTTFNSVMCRHRCQSTFWRGHVKKFLRYIWLLYPCLKCTTLWPAHLLPLLGCSCSHCSISTYLIFVTGTTGGACV